MNSTEVQTLDQWHDMMHESASSPRGAVVLKFSPRCPISRSAEREFDAWCRELADDAGVVCLKVDVVHSRPVSQHLAQELGVRHESPQAIWLTAGQQVHWHASPYSITKQALTTQLHSLQP